MDHRFEIIVNPQYRTIRVVSDDPQIQNIARVGGNFRLEELPELIYALKQVSETPRYIYRESDGSVLADCDLVRASLYREDNEYHYEFDRKLCIEVLSAYAVQYYLHKEILRPFSHQNIRSLSDVQHLLD